MPTLLAISLVLCILQGSEHQLTHFEGIFPEQATSINPRRNGYFGTVYHGHRIHKAFYQPVVD